VCEVMCFNRFIFNNNETQFQNLVLAVPGIEKSLKIFVYLISTIMEVWLVSGMIKSMI